MDQKQPQMHFEGEEADERVLFFLRAHPITNLPWIIVVLASLAVPLFVSAFFAAFPQSKISLEPRNLFSLTATWYLAIFGFALLSLLHWYFNIYILTNKRVVDVDFHGLFYRAISQTTLENVQDITFTKGGVFQNFFDYGDLFIQTAGTAPNFEFRAIPDPEGSQKKILELIKSRKEGKL